MSKARELLAPIVSSYDDRYIVAEQSELLALIESVLRERDEARAALRGLKGTHCFCVTRYHGPACEKAKAALGDLP